MNPRELTRELLTDAFQFCADSPWKQSCCGRMEAWIEQVDRPCVLAVAGRVKAGKSTLINALLGEDLAVIGATETTATINRFRYGIPDDPERPVCCHWLDGHTTWETKTFLDGLQGTDEPTLQRASQIASLEFYVLNPDLQDITLVDTPGTDALAGDTDDGHEREVERFFELRKRHKEETLELTEKADAVIYLVGQVAHVTNKEFLTEFAGSSSSNFSALNAVGVMSKIDLSDEVMEQAPSLAQSISEKMSDQLHGVLPVSAGLWTGLKRLTQDGGMERLQNMLKAIPPDRLERMLSREQAFVREYADCPVSVEDRRAVKAHISWRAFVLICRALIAHDLDNAVKMLEVQSGFKALQKVVQEHFIQRARILRCHRLLTDLRNMLFHLLRMELPAYQDQLVENRHMLIEFTDFIIAHPKGNSDTAGRLRRYLQNHVPVDMSDTLEKGLLDLLRRIDVTLTGFEHVHRNFLCLKLLDDADATCLPDAERDELRNLFNGNVDITNARHRHLYWRRIHAQSRNETRKMIAAAAEQAYGTWL